jgi:hypothetical protein
VVRPSGFWYRYIEYIREKEERERERERKRERGRDRQIDR